jgi:fructose-bisphosphate aldolase, class II
MLTNPKQLILNAGRGKYAIGSFNTSDIEITNAIISAAEKLNAPVIVETSEKAINYAGLETLAASIIARAKKSSVPVALHLDHGQSLNMVKECLKVGYTSVMLDGSRLDIWENKKITSQAVLLAHENNATCEGELGAIEKVGLKKNYTDPTQVEDFAQATNIDFLAVAIGSAHGVGNDEKLNLELLEKIHKTTKVPLVLHGASGVVKEDVRQAIKLGICKINIDTDIRHTFVRSLYDASRRDFSDPRDIMQEVMAEIQKIVEEKIKLFGSNDKAK